MSIEEANLEAALGTPIAHTGSDGLSQLAGAAKRKRGGQPGNQNTRKHGFRSQVLDQTYRRQLHAAGVEGTDADIAVLRLKLRELLRRCPDHVGLQLAAVSSIARLAGRRRAKDSFGREKNFAPEFNSPGVTQAWCRPARFNEIPSPGGYTSIARTKENKRKRMKSRTASTPSTPSCSLGCHLHVKSNPVRLFRARPGFPAGALTTSPGEPHAVSPGVMRPVRQQ